MSDRFKTQEEIEAIFESIVSKEFDNLVRGLLDFGGIYLTGEGEGQIVHVDLEYKRAAIRAYLEKLLAGFILEDQGSA